MTQNCRGVLNLAQRAGRPRSRRNVRGLSLIEIMIALAIGSLLLVGLVQVFSAARVSYQMSGGMARTQENARFAMEFLQRDLRMAGHLGCVNDQSHLQATPPTYLSNFPAATPATSGLDFVAGSIRGYNAATTSPGDTVNLSAPAGGWIPPLPAAITALAPLPGSDIVQLRFFDGEGLPVTAITNPGGAQTVFTVPAADWATMTANGVNAPTMFGVADCKYADVFPASVVTAGAGTVQVNALINRYTPQPEGNTLLHRAESIVYYIATGAGGRPALWRARADNAGTYPVGSREELVEGIENLQLLFGLDNVPNLATIPPTPPSGFVTQHETAALVGVTEPNWRRVGMVQVGILASSPDFAAATAPVPAQRARALGVSFIPPAVADGRFRAAYESTVALRNRLYGN